MNVNEIKAAVNAGKNVCWAGDAYEVKKYAGDDWCIVCSINGYTVGLTWRDGVTLNGDENQFYIYDDKPYTKSEAEILYQESRRAGKQLLKFEDLKLS